MKYDDRTAVETAASAGLFRRDVLKFALAGSAMAAVGLRAPAVLANAKPFDGVTLRGACFQHIFHTYIQKLLPEFEEQTGMKVEFDLQAFPVYNQRMDLELSTHGSSYDFCNITHSFSGRWISAGWLTPLNDFLNDPNKTAADFDPDDFVSGTQIAYIDANKQVHGFAWEAGAMLLAASRFDLLEKEGIAMPTTLAGMIDVCKAIHNKNGVAAFVADRLHHWNFPPYLMGFGGKVFRDPPGDLMPVLDTPEVIEAATYYSGLLSNYCPPGVLSYTDDQAMRNQLAGRANMRINAMSWLLPLAKSADSRVKDTVRFALMPEGPAGGFPACNANAYGIPAGSSQKDAAWAFIQWATSKKTFERTALEMGGLATPRRSIIEDPRYKEALTINGQDIASMYLDVLERSGREGYMAYRTVPVWPQTGEKINKAIERIASGQADAATSMKAAQAEAVEDIKKAGVKL